MTRKGTLLPNSISRVELVDLLFRLPQPLADSTPSSHTSYIKTIICFSFYNNLSFIIFIGILGMFWGFLWDSGGILEGFGILFDQISIFIGILRISRDSWDILVGFLRNLGFFSTRFRYLLKFQGCKGILEGFLKDLGFFLNRFRYLL